jgi:hypothetical protein
MQILEIRDSTGPVFALHEDDNVLVTDDAYQLGVIVALLQQSLEFVTERVSLPSLLN